MPELSWSKSLLALTLSVSVGGLLVLLNTLSERDSRLPRLALTLPEARARARVAALPRTRADLPPRPAVTDTQNAAGFYRAAVALLPLWTKEERLAIRRILDPQGTPEKKDKSLLEALIRRSAPAIEQVVQGHQRPHCDFGWRGTLTEEDWQERRAILVSCDRLAQLLQVYAYGRRKDPQHALFVLNVVQQMTRHLTQEDGLLVWQSRTYQIVLAARLLALIAREHPERSSEVQRALATWRITPGALKRTWRLQCVKEQEDAERARKKPYKPESAPLLDYNPLWRELDRVDHQLGWKLYADASEVVQLNYWRNVQEALTPLKDSDLVGQWRALKALDEAEDARGKKIPGYWYPQRFGATAGQFLVAETVLQLANLEFSLHEFQVKKGRAPLNLAELATPELTQDPFSGRTLIWKAPLLYSVGPDGVDHGGSPTKDVLWNLETTTAPLGLRSRRSATRRPGHVAGQVE